MLKDTPQKTKVTSIVKSKLTPKAALSTPKGIFWIIQAIEKKTPTSSLKNTNTEVLKTVKSKIIQILALKPQTANFLHKALNCPLSDVQSILNTVARLEISSGLYYLQDCMYKQVQIFDWPTYSAKDRQKVIDNCTKAFKIMGIESNAPEWQRLLPEKEPEPKTQPKVPVPLAEAPSAKPTPTRKRSKKPTETFLSKEKGSEIEDFVVSEDEEPNSKKSRQSDKYCILAHKYDQESTLFKRKMEKYRNIDHLLQKETEFFLQLKENLTNAKSEEEKIAMKKTIHEEFNRRIEKHNQLEEQYKALQQELASIKDSVQKIVEEIKRL